MRQRAIPAPLDQGPCHMITLARLRNSAARVIRPAVSRPPLPYGPDQAHIAPETPAIVIRALSADDTRAFRTIGLEALNRDGRYFAADLATEAARSEEEWAAACAETPARAVFGGFVNGRLAGIMAARRWDGDADGRSVCWGSAYVQPAHRRTGLGRLLYGTREQWSRQHGYAVAVIAIRETNARSIQIHTDNGAARFGAETMRYADGSEGLTFWFRKPLGPPAA